MWFRKNVGLLLFLYLCAPLMVMAQEAPALHETTRVRSEPDGRFFVNDLPVFPIGFTSGPPTGATAVNGTNGMTELRREGFTFQQWQCPKHAWGPAKEAELDALVEEANKRGMHVAISIADLQDIVATDTVHVAELKRVLSKYRNNPAIFLWKGDDEPQWGKVPVEHLRTYRDTVHELDPNHPVWITQAPRGTVDDLKPYSEFFDVGAIDIYPVSYPPGGHSGIENKS